MVGSKLETSPMRSLWLVLTFLILPTLAALPQATNSPGPVGTISGSVLDEHGQPIKGMQVCTWMRGAPAGSKESRGDCPAATTDEAGEFRIDHVAMGTIGVEAIKPEDGYVAFAGTSVAELVTLTPNQSSATVVLKLGPKPGFLLPTVKDKFTGKVIPKVSIRWVVIDPNEPNGLSSGGTGGHWQPGFHFVIVRIGPLHDHRAPRTIMIIRACWS